MIAPLLLALAPFVPPMQCTTSAPIGQTPPAAEPRATTRADAGQRPVTRQDLATLVQRLDALLAGPLVRGELTADALRAVNERFDRISLQFFGGDLGSVNAALAGWIDELAGAPPAAGPAHAPPASAPADGPAPLAAVRAEVEALLAGATITDTASLRVLRARLALLVDAPSPERSREFLLATPALAAAVRNEAVLLCAGERPYRGRSGDLWRTVAHGRRDLALRLYTPSAPGREPRPLVVAFHGAGGDENFLFELAGDGYLKRLADEHGFMVVCPLTADFVLSAPAFDALLAGLAADYAIDPARVFLLGHSMGASAASNLCRLRPASIAKAVCVAGFGGADAGSPPVLVLAGELDPIAPPARLRRSAEATRAAGADVTFELLADQGHTLLLPAAMRRAVEFWLQD